MKCPHCGQEHPNNFQFCPNTGQRLTTQFKACINKQCLDYGKYILPLDSRFCPSCGKPLDNQIGENDNGNEANDILRFSINGIYFNMILVEHGSFTMGATSELEGVCPDEMPAHKVTLTKDYYMGETQVTQALWEAIMGGNPSKFKGKERPVECVNWYDCQEFVKKLNRRLHSQLHGKSFRLPTEAEWEFAARGGNKSCGYQFSGSDDLDEVACYSDNEDDETCDVASFEPNELKIYDMNGNVYEWCLDWCGRYKRSAQRDPKGPSSGSCRVLRGGGWYFDSIMEYRLSYRGGAEPDEIFDTNGFRLTLSE